MRDLIGRTLGHYRIVDKIGEGGMGEVYKAHDERLDRDVAVKVLAERVATSKDRVARFEREAKAIAKLSHPNILEIWDFGTEEGITYAVTELLEGESLRARIAPGGMSWQKASDIGTAVAEGLAAAHGKSVVHRDLKPENIFITSDGRVKILDFGLARIKEPVDEHAETATLTPAGTVPGTIMGTVGYMSPEQLRGETVDGRSDIFALGCVLYEMLSAQSAFLRNSTAETTAAILKEEPPSLSDTGTTVPAELERTVRRCLEKAPEARFQSSSDLAYALRTISGVPIPPVTLDATQRVRKKKITTWAAVGILIVFTAALAAILSGLLQSGLAVHQEEISPNRIAVAPMENRTGDPTLDPLGVMAADLIAQRFIETASAEVMLLTQHDSVSELNRGENRGRSQLLRIARRLGAGLVLSGAYYLEGEILHFQARLVDAATEDLIYSFELVTASRETPSEGVESLCKRILAAVAAHLSQTVDIGVMRPPSSYEALQAYIRSEEYWGEDWPKAIEHLRRARELDPDFHFAQISYAVALHLSANEVEARRHIRELEKRRARMTPWEQAYLQHQVAILERDRQGSVSTLRRCLELGPQVSWVRHDLALRLLQVNRAREAIEVLETAVLPETVVYEHQTWWAFIRMTAAHHMLGDYEREIEYATMGLEHFPNVSNLFGYKARALAAMGETGAVKEVLGGMLRVQTSGASAGAVMSVVARELRAHGHRRDGDDMAAQADEWYAAHTSAQAAESWHFCNVLWMLGRWGQIEQLATRKINSRENVDDKSAISWLGVLAVLTAIEGDTDKARRLSDDLSARENPISSADVAAWRAAIAAHLGDSDGAVQLLSEAFSRGWPYSVSHHCDPVLEPLWANPAFQELIEPRG
jgi:serine/threonine protein kinase/tetratricopeptide (TPR) repeat protein